VPGLEEPRVPASEVRVDEVVGGAKLGPVNLQAWVLAALMLFVDAFDFAALPVGSPAILESFSLPKETLGLIFSAGSVGIVVGSVVFGYFADRLGRRKVAILGTLLFSVSTLATAFADSATHLMIGRLLTGIGVGGVTPTAITYLTEWAPAKRRSAFVTAALMGYPLGDATLAIVGKELIPHWGWQIVFVVPGVIGIVLCVIMFLALRESLLYLAVKRPNAPELRQRLRQLSPTLNIDAHTRILAEHSAPTRRGPLSMLLAGELRLITPLLWAGYLLESLAFGSFNSWFQLTLISLGLSRDDAALALSISGGTRVLMILLLAAILDRAGYRVGVALAATAALAFFIMGTGVGGTTMLMAAAVAALVAGLTLHSAFNGTVGSFYPTPIRSRGVALATAWGRFGQIIGPSIVGLAMNHISTPRIFGGAFVLYLLLVAICLVLFLLDRKSRANRPLQDLRAEPETS